MFPPPSLDLARIERLANSITEPIKQLNLSIEKSSTHFSAASMREQTLANIHIILTLYVYDDPQEFRIPTIIISDTTTNKDKKQKQVYAAVVRTRYNDDLNKPELVTVIEGPCCASDFKALESLYKLSRTALQRAIVMSKNPGGFDDWDDLDLS